MSNPDDTTLAFTVADGPFATDQEIGPYRLLHKLGAGGMGEVWLAEQREPVRRRVAIKFVRAGLDGTEAIARFESERQALAMMDHPGIARMFEAGVLSDSRPFFAMEYVRGGPITEYCDQHELDLADRIRLFIRVCAGVQHAHHKAVLHRDLKPSNILVSDFEGEEAVKVIDFGIAKAMARSLTEETLHTRLGQVVGTPKYMSPEQSDPFSQSVDTRSDVYSLGVVLYELLTGTFPYDDSALERLRSPDHASATSPLRPSTRVREVTAAEAKARRCTTPAQLARTLRGELDWILLKAVDPQPKHRYGSAQELSRELERFLANEPVDAGPPSAWYRARKFYARHRVGVSALVGLILALVVGGALATSGFLSARRSAAEAQRQQTNAEAVAGFLTGLFQRADPRQTGGRDISARELLDQGVERLGESLEDAPEPRFAVLTALADVYRELGNEPQARSLLEEALQLEDRLGRTTLETKLSYGDLLRDMDATEEAIKVLEAVEANLPPLTEATSALHVKSTNDLGLVYLDADRVEDAEAALSRSLDIRRRFDGERSASVATALHNLSLVRGRERRLDEAIRLGQEALSIRRELLGNRHPRIASALTSIATNLSNAGRVDEAESHLLEAADIRRALGVQDDRLAAVLSELGWVRFQQRRYAEAQASYEEALEIVEPAGRFPVRLQLVQNEMGMLMEDQGDLEAALRLYRDSLNVGQSIYQPPHSNLHNMEAKVAKVLIQLGRAREADALLEQAIAGYTAARGPEDARTLAVRITRLRWLVEIGQSDLAVQEADELLDLVRGNLHPGNTLVARGLAYEELERLEEALEDFARAEDRLSQTGSRFLLHLAEAQAHRARLLAEAGDADEARATAQRALESYSVIGGNHTLEAVAQRIAGSSR